MGHRIKFNNEEERKERIAKERLSPEHQAKEKEWQRSRLERNPEHVRKISAKAKNKSRSRNRQFILDKKNQGCCSVCGLKDHRCLDFHHLNPESKKNALCILVANNHSIQVLQEEIDKCDILCSNCHRIEHYKNGYFNYKQEKEESSQTD